MTDIVSIYNMSLSHLGNASEVQSASENSANATACTRFYTQCVDETLEAFAWPFATVRVLLGLVAADPSPEWLYSYRYPSDCVKALRIATALYSFRNPAPQQIIPYKIAADATGRLIYTDIGTANLGNPYLEYVQRVTDPTLFPAAFAQAVSLLLAAYIAPRVTGGDPANLGSKAAARYQYAIAVAQANAFNELQMDQPPDAEWIVDREQL